MRGLELEAETIVRTSIYKTEGIMFELKLAVLFRWRFQVV